MKELLFPQPTDLTLTALFRAFEEFKKAFLPGYPRFYVVVHNCIDCDMQRIYRYKAALSGEVDILFIKEYGVNEDAWKIACFDAGTFEPLAIMKSEGA